MDNLQIIEFVSKRGLVSWESLRDNGFHMNIREYSRLMDKLLNLGLIDWRNGSQGHIVNKEACLNYLAQEK